MSRRNRPSPVTSEAGRQGLSADFARAAFDRVDRLGPEWRAGVFSSREATLAADIIVFDKDGDYRGTLDSGVTADSLDTCAVEAERKLKRLASVPGSIVVANNTAGNKAAFTYDPVTDAFTPLPLDKLPPRRDGCCGHRCPPCLWNHDPAQPVRTRKPLRTI